VNYFFDMINRWIIFYSISFFTLAGCNPLNNKNVKETATVDSSTLLKDGEKLQIDTSEEDINNNSNSQSIDVAILEGKLVMPLTYRFLNDEDRISKLLNPNWPAIYKEKGTYHIGKVVYRIIEEAEEPCSGLPTETIKTDKDVLTFVNLQTLKIGLIDSIVIKERIIQPDNPYKFIYNGHEYELKARGKYFRDMDDPRADSYNLNLYKDGKYIRSLINQSEYNDTYTEVKLMADFDGDKEPDFLISSPRHYEEVRYLLILSGQKDVYEGNMIFDC